MGRARMEATVNPHAWASRLRRRGTFLLCIGAVRIMHGFGILTGTRKRFAGFGSVLGPIVNHPYFGVGLDCGRGCGLLVRVPSSRG
jgi:hypothetical protein